MQIIERIFVALILVALLPCLIGAFIRSIGPFNLLLVLAILCVAAYLRHGSAPPRAEGRRSGTGAERTPILPRGDH